MPTTQLPQVKEKAHEISKKIANERPLKKDKDTPDANVTGGFNQKSRTPEATKMLEDAEDELRKAFGRDD
ncbi:MAG: hypothetical protein ABI697_08175 [Devosia sp.]